MSVLELYLLNLLFTFRDLLLSGVFIGVIWLGAVVIILIMFEPCCFDKDSDAKRKEANRRKTIKSVKPVLIAMVACIVLRTFIPTKEAAVWIAGGYIATNIEGIEDLPAHAVKAINSFLESVSEEI